MVFGKIYLNKELNKEFYDLLEEYNVIMDKWNSCNERICSFILPRIFFINTKKKIFSIGREISKLQKHFLEWNKKATTFFNNPHFKFDPDQKNREIVFHHFTNSLRHSIGTLNSHMTLIADNYNKLYTQFGNRVSFNIAIFAFIVSIIGLFFSLFGTFENESISIELNKLKIPEKIYKIESEIDTLGSLLVNLKNIDSLKFEMKSITEAQNKILEKVKNRNDLKEK